VLGSSFQTSVILVLWQSQLKTAAAGTDVDENKKQKIRITERASSGKTEPCSSKQTTLKSHKTEIP